MKKVLNTSANEHICCLRRQTWHSLRGEGWAGLKLTKQNTKIHNKNYEKSLGGLNCAIFPSQENSAVEAVLGVVLGDECQHPQQQASTEEW